MVFTNVPGPKYPLDFGGQKSKSMMFFVPALGTLASGFSVLSHDDVIKVGFISDSSCCDNPQDIIDIFEKNAYQVINT